MHPIRNIFPPGRHKQASSYLGKIHIPLNLLLRIVNLLAPVRDTMIFYN